MPVVTAPIIAPIARGPDGNKLPIMPKNKISEYTTAAMMITAARNLIEATIALLFAL